MAITFQSQQVSFVMKHKQKIRKWIQQVIFSERKLVGQINFQFTNDHIVLINNIQFLNHNTLTDIITFDSTEGKKISGDILISVERVLENAKKFGVDFENELKRVIIHGILHLCGYKDKTNADLELMRSKENKALKMYQKKFQE